ncbi:hypothetical protein E2C01_010805 [Portunus trituberculatus]|uniref:Uncharacterized protein n=1 Tax=Portunus trituberculatus TaxID=210409 RepID=A0A5B7D9U7_PORTR|nr:hypothetical protein [Portunus trituberculatus]
MLEILPVRAVTALSTVVMTLSSSSGTLLECCFNAYPDTFYCPNYADYSTSQTINTIFLTPMMLKPSQ